jgi:hypothetical protein
MCKLMKRGCRCVRTKKPCKLKTAVSGLLFRIGPRPADPSALVHEDLAQSRKSRTGTQIEVVLLSSKRHLQMIRYSDQSLPHPHYKKALLARFSKRDGPLNKWICVTPSMPRSTWPPAPPGVSSSRAVRAEIRGHQTMLPHVLDRHLPNVRRVRSDRDDLSGWSVDAA